jgi:hypothetical protein
MGQAQIPGVVIHIGPQSSKRQAEALSKVGSERAHNPSGNANFHYSRHTVQPERNDDDVGSELGQSFTALPELISVLAEKSWILTYQPSLSVLPQS